MWIHLFAAENPISQMAKKNMSLARWVRLMGSFSTWLLRNSGKKDRIMSMQLRRSPICWYCLFGFNHCSILRTRLFDLRKDEVESPGELGPPDGAEVCLIARLIAAQESLKAERTNMTWTSEMFIMLSSHLHPFFWIGFSQPWCHMIYVWILDLIFVRLQQQHQRAPQLFGWVWWTRKPLNQWLMVKSNKQNFTIEVIRLVRTCHNITYSLRFLNMYK